MAGKMVAAAGYYLGRSIRLFDYRRIKHGRVSGKSRRSLRRFARSALLSRTCRVRRTNHRHRGGIPRIEKQTQKRLENAVLLHAHLSCVCSHLVHKFGWNDLVVPRLRPWILHFIPSEKLLYRSRHRRKTRGKSGSQSAGSREKNGVKKISTKTQNHPAD